MPAPDPAAAARRLLQSLDGQIEPVPVGFLYRAGLLLVAVAMLVLPLIYLSLVALIGYGVYYHAAENVTLLQGRGNARGRLLVYLAPLVVGGLLVLFMIKPLFARKRSTSQPLSLRREDQPLLFEFVDRLCRLVGAPSPRRIDVDTEVNASAGFLGGPVSLLTNRLVLTVGLPLVAGLSLRQFAGVLAHEFGHSAQGSAMRLTYVIRSINIWFARLVYERDEWDYKLEEFQHADHWGVQLLVGLTRVCVWLTRRVLWVLMWVGHGISSFMLRQMEYDADRYEARVAGTDAFVETVDRLGVLNVAASAAFSDLGAAWRERRLCDDLPSLIRAREAHLPREVLQAVRKHSAESKTGWFDSHPSDAARVAAVRREPAPGLLKVDAPASVLFNDFAGLSRQATVAFYFQAVGPEVTPQNLVKTEELVAARGQQRENVQALRRFFCDLVSPVRPVFPERFTVRPARGAKLVAPDAAAERLLELRTTLCAASPDAVAAAKLFDELDQRVLSLERIRELNTAGVKPGKVNPRDLGVTSLAADEVARAIRQGTAERERARGEVDRFLRGAMERLTLALSLESVARGGAGDPAAAGASPGATARADNPAGDDYEFAADYGEEYALADDSAEGSDDRMLDALRALAEAAPRVEELRKPFVFLGGLLSHAQPGQNPQPLVEAVLWQSRKASDLLREIHTSLRTAEYPYSHAEKRVSLAAFAVTAQPPSDEPVAVYSAAESAMDAIYPLYVRLLSDLAARAEQVEAALGFPPMPDPPEED